MQHHHRKIVKNLANSCSPQKWTDLNIFYDRIGIVLCVTVIYFQNFFKKPPQLPELFRSKMNWLIRAS